MEVGLAAAQLGVAVADWLISPLAQKVVNRALSYLGSCPSDNLKNLETDTQLIKAILRTADARPPGDILEPWMKQLRTAYSKAEDILDVIDYHRIESHILSQKHDKTASTASPSNTGEDIHIPQESKTELNEALDKIRNLISEGQRLLSPFNLQAGYDNINSTSSILAKPITTTSAPPTAVFGRDGERDKIIEDLRGSPAAGKCYTVVGIHGVAGSGKTTLAQHVLEQQSADEHFDVIMWIHVTQTFSEINILKDMLENASDKTEVQRPPSHPDMLQRELTEKLKGKRFFLVLDDVWYEKGVTEQKLRLLLGSLKHGKIGSRILVTSRTTDVAGALGAKSHLVSDLKEEDYILMFLHYALHGATLTDEESREHRSIGRQIAKKLGRSPLAATTVASQLKIRQDDIQFWRDVLKSDLWKDTTGALFWSYQQLEENVKQCFRYCSIFPRGYELKRDELVRLWMAEGFVKTTSDEEDMEQVAKDYFQVLLSSSFIQPKQNPSENEKEYFTIHDLLHGLAEHLAGSDCFRVKRGMVGQIPPDVRHIFIESYDPGMLTEQILNLDALHTVMMSRSGDKITEREFKSLLSNQKKLRVLHVTLQSLRELPECIGELKHLRSLELWGFSPITINLPQGFTKLYHLQMFAVARGTPLECSASEKMANLVNLRYIECLELIFPNIGRLTWLRTLRRFTVKMSKGYEIHQLERLDNLCGTLMIDKLDNVKSKDEALQAKLHNKLDISDLTLQWQSNPPKLMEQPQPLCHNKLDISDLTLQWQSNPPKLMEQPPPLRVATKQATAEAWTPTQAEVFEALRPPFLIKSLTITKYRGRGETYPSWMLEEQGGLDNLQELTLSDCDFPPKNLVGCLNLRTLWISRCGWYSLPKNLERLKSLRILTIQFCENIQSIPELPESLKLLQIVGCPKLTKSYKQGGPRREKLIRQKTEIKISEYT